MYSSSFQALRVLWERVLWERVLRAVKYLVVKRFCPVREKSQHDECPENNSQLSLPPCIRMRIMSERYILELRARTIRTSPHVVKLSRLRLEVMQSQHQKRQLLSNLSQDQM